MLVGPDNRGKLWDGSKKNFRVIAVWAFNVWKSSKPLPVTKLLLLGWKITLVKWPLALKLAIREQLGNDFALNHQASVSQSVN